MVDTTTAPGTVQSLLILAALVTVLAVPALASAAPAGATTGDDDNDHGHEHDDGSDHGHEHGDGGDVVLWDGAGRGNVDCTDLEAGQTRWEFHPGTDHDVTSVELHIDEPSASVTTAEGPPFVWVTPYHDLDVVEADADGFTGTPGADAELSIVAYCPDELAETGAQVAWIALLVAGMLVGGGLLARTRRTA